MGIRMERQISNCQRIADFLEKHPLVKKINYPGLAQHSRSDVQCRQAKNGGSLLSFETGRCLSGRNLIPELKYVVRIATESGKFEGTTWVEPLSCRQLTS